MNKEKRLNKRQVQILEDMFSRLLMKETMEDIAKSHGISRKTLSQWKNSEHGKQLNLEFQRRHSESFIQSFYDLVHEKMQTSFKDRELFAKLHGLMKPEKHEVHNANENQNIVKDGLTKNHLADLEALLDGETKIKRIK
ncbi:phBC6A51 family helix-turn-helix protein [Pseudobacillus badius]|uniref:phBC6A51 family helix-turn-helix protein n=1 Tax=Bacillus badius TaxID=1455 RepID=UPI003CECA870